MALWIPNILFLLFAGAGMWVVAGEREVNLRTLVSWTRRLLGLKGADA
jgi:lipopolysaccharide export system permease protein